ncbi:ATP-binding cassette, subfamily F, uup [Thomasclavelia cocleata]|uniref:ATP-binding cassette, subfamily F, uup n=2 Tax=Thomasclavelia cocleata TaxID=69824 RepID=A0A1I0GW72_9FIRM|nr:ABC-F family ATP-binding cassette domain-containing protein [Thomasclavelia cocleata]MCI9131809.1 ABC-F family ATP-binding cassette domain-containing protein [Thomasclavelia cocleata]MCR1960799.1 ABC-F family ATP-binding cassette domain-containing protein [Thomasclavelia cocleata]NDO42541.1 ABC-F family ATP-binding cassette domain-containing protein [Thomasclavelia cocleata]SET75492.1 ATP-binding cassette, subfamily F, uup [Thomasclavelia cocleata]
MLISVNNLSKTNGIKNIVDNVSFSIEETDKIALIGINGTGKSTLLKIIAGIETYQGDIIQKKDLQISYLPQNSDFNSNNTIIRQVYDIIDQNKVNEYEIKAILNKLGITNHEQLIKELSGGQQKRVALAITLLKPCDLLILDEPTNHLDNEMIEYLEKYLIKFNKAIFMVTHDRYFLERVTNKIMEIDRSKIYEYEANYSKFLDLKAKREEEALASERKRKLFLKKELEWVRAGVQARTTKSKERLQRFEQLNSVADIQTINQVEIINTASRLGKKTIELKNISMHYDNLSLFNNFSYLFKRTERIGILGVNGCGKSTLLKIIAKELKPSSGEVIYGDTIKIGYFKQMSDDLDENVRVIDYIKQTSNNLKTLEGNFSAKQMCERFLFDSNLQHAYISRLSGGEKRRLYLLNILMQAPNVLLFDEPTNDLDITTLAILEDYLDSFNGIVITVSHDRYFLDRICDGLFVFKNKQITYCNGGYSSYVNIDDKSSKTKSDGAFKYKVQKKLKKLNQIRLSSKEKQELESMESIILDLEQQVEILNEQMNEYQNDFKKLTELSNQRDNLTEQLEIKNERWLELLEKQEKSQN